VMITILRLLAAAARSCFRSRFQLQTENLVLRHQINILRRAAPIRIPFRSPQANAIAKRWVRSLRTECLDHLLILNERHLRKVVPTVYSTRT
jgi:transposase InsO family protein